MSYDLKKTINDYWNNNFSFKTIYFQRFRPKRKNLGFKTITIIIAVILITNESNTHDAYVHNDDWMCHISLNQTYLLLVFLMFAIEVT